MFRQLPPVLSGKCCVCGDSAHHHLHYGAVSCYSCRAFFRRTVQKSLVCVTGKNNCKITTKLRTSCKKCRYDACLAAGMVPALVDAAARKKVAEEISEAKKEFCWTRKKPLYEKDPSNATISWENQDGCTENMSLKVQEMTPPPLERLPNKPVQYGQCIDNSFKPVFQNVTQIPHESRALKREVYKSSTFPNEILSRTNMQIFNEPCVKSATPGHFQPKKHKQRKFEKKIIHNFMKIKELREQKALIEKAIDHYTEISFENKNTLPSYPQRRSKNRTEGETFPYPMERMVLQPNILQTEEKVRKHKNSRKCPTMYEQYTRLQQIHKEVPNPVWQHEDSQNMPRPIRVVTSNEQMTFQTSEKERKERTSIKKYCEKIKSPVWRQGMQVEHSTANTSASQAEQNYDPKAVISMQIRSNTDKNDFDKHEQFKDFKNPSSAKREQNRYVSQQTRTDAFKTSERLQQQNSSKQLYTDYENMTQFPNYKKQSSLPPWRRESQMEHRNKIPLQTETECNYVSTVMKPKNAEHSEDKTDPTYVTQAIVHHTRNEVNIGKSNFHDISQLIMQEHQNIQMHRSDENTDYQGANTKQVGEGELIDQRENQPNFEIEEKGNQKEKNLTVGNLNRISEWINDIGKQRVVKSNSTSIDSMSNEAEDPNLDDVIEEVSSDENEDNSSTDEEPEEEEVELEEDDKTTDDDLLQLSLKADIAKDEPSKCCRAVQKIAMPIKKRKRMRQMPYPKSRFISIKKVPVFDLTVEEEFRIHDIDFRRFTEYNGFIKMMKQTLGSRYESFKKGIFSSAFELDKVVLDPELHEEVFNLAMKTHSECVHVYQEVQAVPKETWEQLCVPVLKTWNTYNWSLCWANVDAVSLIEQETKAGFWDQEIQAIYDSLFPNNPTAVRSLNMEDWEMFVSPWASSQSDEEMFKKTMYTVGHLTGKDRLLSSLYGLLIFLTPSNEMDENVRNDPTLTFLRNEITRLIYRYLKSELKSCSQASNTTHHLVKLIPDLHTSTHINFNKRIQVRMDDFLHLL